MLAVRRTRHRNGRAELTAYREACAGGEWQLYVAGEFDDATTGSLADVLDDACRERARRIVIDCSAVTFADVAFLRALLTPTPTTSRSSWPRRRGPCADFSRPRALSAVFPSRTVPGPYRPGDPELPRHPAGIAAGKAAGRTAPWCPEVLCVVRSSSVTRPDHSTGHPERDAHPGMSRLTSGAGEAAEVFGRPTCHPSAHRTAVPPGLV